MVKAPTVDLVAQNMRQIYESGYSLDQIFSIPPHKYNPENGRFEKSGNKSAAAALADILKEIKEKDIKSPIIVATYASLKSIYRNYPKLMDQLKDILDFYVSDEAHETTGPVGSDMKIYFMDRENEDHSHDKFHMLLTATADRKNMSLFDIHHEMISIKLQECFEDEILVRP